MPPAPHITSINPTHGEPGDQVGIKGSNFVKRQTKVTFSPDVAGRDVEVDNDGYLDVTVPDGAVTGNVVVTIGALVSNPHAFTVDDPPVGIASFEPTHGGSSTYVVITGKGFADGRSVQFGTHRSTQIAWTSDTRITAVVPRGAPKGRVFIKIITGAGEATSKQQFEIS